MKKLFVKFGTIFDSLNGLLLWITAILLAVGWFSVCYEVFSRSMLDSPTKWSLEIIEKSLVFITFLGAAWLLKEDGHVRIDLFVMWLPPRAQMILNIATSVLSAIACLVVFWYGSQVVWEQFQMGYRDPTVLELPQGPIYLVIPFGFFLLFVQYLRRAYGYLISRRSQQSEHEVRS
jgi:TRAP-type C4-dicarboxylate transport system permease small subunit